MSAKYVAIIVLVCIFMLILELIRRERLTFKFAFGWMIAVVIGLIIAVADRLFEQLSLILGFELLSNFLFFC